VPRSVAAALALQHISPLLQSSPIRRRPLLPNSRRPRRERDAQAMQDLDHGAENSGTIPVDQWIVRAPKPDVRPGFLAERHAAGDPEQEGRVVIRPDHRSAPSAAPIDDPTPVRYVGGVAIHGPLEALPARSSTPYRLAPGKDRPRGVPAVDGPAVEKRRCRGRLASDRCSAGPRGNAGWSGQRAACSHPASVGGAPGEPAVPPRLREGDPGHRVIVAGDAFVGRGPRGGQRPAARQRDQAPCVTSVRSRP
jgi:hypothetical protein